MKYENTFKAIDQILWKEQGCGSELDYLEQKSWMLFLKYLDDLETEREDEAELEGKTYKTMVGYKDYLERTYGDYMTLPPVEQRVTHKFEAYWL